MSLIQDIKHKALEVGFDLMGITDASPISREQADLLTDWLKAGFAGRMNYMHRNFEKRINPSKLLQGAQSVICLGLNYTPPKQKLKSPDTTNPTGRVANYAQYEDYHLFAKKLLRKLTDFIDSIAGRVLRCKICVDSAPLAERALAARAGLGFIGKNHMLINPTLGTQIFLSEIITSLKLRPDEPASAMCSNCNKCIDACPTGALMEDGKFDARKCIGYLTIEYKDRIPPALADKMGDWLFGCDECALVCPLQQDAPVCKNMQFKFYSDRATLNLRRILDLTEKNFEAGFTDSPIKRLGLERLKRNAEICLKNGSPPPFQ